MVVERWFPPKGPQFGTTRPVAAAVRGVLPPREPNRGANRTVGRSAREDVWSHLASPFDIPGAQNGAQAWPIKKVEQGHGGGGRPGTSGAAADGTGRGQVSWMVSFLYIFMFSGFGG